jgi:hypothetical protein
MREAMEPDEPFGPFRGLLSSLPFIIGFWMVIVVVLVLLVLW